MTSNSGRTGLRSEKCEKKCYVQFVNQSDRCIEVVWINYSGNEELYRILLPKEKYDMNTFVTHPWIFRDHLTHQPLTVNSSNVFHPRQSVIRVDVPQDPNLANPVVHYRLVRAEVQIRIPVYSLKELCIYTVRKVVQNESSIRLLELPQSLREELLKPWINSD